MRDFFGDGQTVTLGPPVREKPGFGCPACAKPLHLEGTYALGCIAAGRSPCGCGYVPDAQESVRWIRTARLLNSNASAH